ncbi:MAG: FAD-dependent oxidoreductase [Clostridia bacterium]|nr:FAD-dependent oxidoreductase [Clostridia bacterium]
MKRVTADIIIVGGSLGGVLAAYSAGKSGKKAILFCETEWIGGQLTSQAVPPDEHKWIEETGCTASYRAYRNAVRAYYRNHPDIIEELKTKDYFCPGGSSVSRLSHPPVLALSLLTEMLAPYVQSGLVTVVTRAVLTSAAFSETHISCVRIKAEEEEYEATGSYYLDATDEGDLIAASGTAYVTGAESRAMTGEPSAAESYDPDDRQPVTWSLAFENCLTGDYVIDKPYGYERYKKLITPYDCYPVFSMYGPDSSTGRAKLFGMYNGESDAMGNKLFGLYTYRRIVNSGHFKRGVPYDVTMLNWPQNDYFLGNTFDDPNAAEHREEARQLTLSFFYWLQTEAPNGDKRGYPFFRACGEAVGTKDGTTQTYYVRESRRIVADFTVTEKEIGLGGNPVFFDSVGVGSYPIDLHITTRSHSFFYKPSERFTVPLGAMIPVKMQNLIPACKNIGTTHLTGGCYRLHPIEWNVGEVAGLLAAYSLDHGVTAREIRADKARLADFQDYLIANGIQLYW